MNKQPPTNLPQKHLEIEKKFLVDHHIWQESIYRKNASCHTITQGYITTQPQGTVRVRIKDEKSFLTIKGKAIGITRAEFEYPIPYADAQMMLSAFTTNHIIKKRYVFTYKGFTWEVDEFEGLQAPLILAEVELRSEKETPICPDFITEDVSEDIRYTNSFLSQKPYTTW